MYIETGFRAMSGLAKKLDIVILAEDGKPSFTDREDAIVNSFVDRLNRGYQRACEGPDSVEYHPELLPYIQRTVVGFALKHWARAGDDQALYREKIASFLKSWLFDRDPMSWIRVRELLRFAPNTKQGAFQRFLHTDEFATEKQEALRIMSLFPSYMKSRSRVEADFTTVSAAVVNLYIHEFKPVGGIFGPDNLSDLSTHMRLAKGAGLLR